MSLLSMCFQSSVPGGLNRSAERQTHPPPPSGCQPSSIRPHSSRDPIQLELPDGHEPFPRNEAKGALQANESRAEQLGRQSTFLLDRVLADIADAHSAMSATGMKLDLSRENQQVAIELREIEAHRFQLGAVDLFKLQILEQTAFKAEQDYHQAQYDVFRSLVNFLVAAAVDFRPSPRPGSDGLLPEPLQALITSLGLQVVLTPGRRGGPRIVFPRQPGNPPACTAIVDPGRTLP
ncbi:MAG: TolC family protein [Verrucomicrobia bacterium]|nr:TolC family protein [Verrucomicrobiota bacterium]